MESIKKNFVYNVIYEILVVLLPLITAPYISRTLGSTAVGIYSYTYSVAQYFLLFAKLGIANHGNRSIAAVRDDIKERSRTFWSIYLIQFVTFSTAIIIYTVYALFVVNENRVIALLQLLYVGSGLFDIGWFFFGLEKFKITVTRNMIIKLSTVVCMFIFVHEPSDLWKYTLIMALGAFISQIYLWSFLRREVHICRICFVDMKKHIKPIVILFIPVIAYSIYRVMDKIMLGNMSNYDQVGFYNSAEKIINIPTGVITALGTVMLPRMSNLIANGDFNKTNQYIRVSFKLVTIIGAAIAFGLIGVADIITPVYFGNDFLPTAPIIVLLSVTVFFMAWANVIRTQYLIPYGIDKVYLVSTVIGAVSNLIVNALLIPRYQAIGAAIGTIVAEFSLMFVQMVAIRKKLPISQYFKSIAPVMLIGVFMTVIVRIIGDFMGIGIGTVVVQVCVGGVVYLSLLALYLFLSKDEMFGYLLQMFKFRPRKK